MLGTYALSSGYYDAYYLKALKVRDIIRGSLDSIFSTYDAVIGPVAPTAAYGLGEKAADPLAMYLGDIYTVTANIAGCPAISVPAGFDDNKMPVGLQIMCARFEEEKLFDIARAYTGHSNHIYEIPNISQEKRI
jgi:aspartyl-tRNA(Asn)/glutamyl-tRNA(Gln) amidotransferase subunit A